jgi:hypothetical protein
MLRYIFRKVVTTPRFAWYLILFTCLGALVAPGSASAQATCPNGVSEMACDADPMNGATANDVCLLSGGVWTCDLDIRPAAATQAAQVNAIIRGSA